MHSDNLSEKLSGMFLALGMGCIVSLIVFTTEMIRECVGWFQKKGKANAMTTPN